MVSIMHLMAVNLSDLLTGGTPTTYTTWFFTPDIHKAVIPFVRSCVHT